MARSPWFQTRISEAKPLIWADLRPSEKTPLSKAPDPPLPTFMAAAAAGTLGRPLSQWGGRGGGGGSCINPLTRHFLERKKKPTAPYILESSHFPGDEIPRPGQGSALILHPPCPGFSPRTGFQRGLTHLLFLPSPSPTPKTYNTPSLALLPSPG